MRSFKSFLLAMMVSMPVLAGVNRWTTHGPEGPTTINQLVTDPSNPAVVYAVAPLAGIFKSVDGSDSWRVMNEGLTDRAITALALEPGSWSTAYAGTLHGQLFKSADGGEHWVELTRPETAAIRRLAIVAGMIYIGTEHGLLRSEDGGHSWQRPEGPLQDAEIQSLVVHSNGTLYARRETGILYRSSTRGDSWEAINGSGQPLPTPIGATAFDRVTSTLYFGFNDTIYRSRDDGRTFEQLPAVKAYVTSLFGEETGRDALYALSGSSIYQYLDDDKQWRLVARANQDIIRTTARGNLFPARLYAGGFRGVQMNIEGETSLVEANRGMNAATLAQDVAVVPAKPSLAYATTRVGLFRTDDSGNSWTQISPSLDDATEVEVDPRSPDNVLAGSSYTLQKSRDGGTNWKTVRKGGVSTLAVAPSDPSRMYAAFADAIGKSSDGGESWTVVSTGLPLAYYSYYYGFTASSLAVDPSDASNVYLGEPSGIFKTNDAGTSWTRIPDSPFASALAVDPFHPSIIYAGASFGTAVGVFKSTDGGINFKQVGLAEQAVQSVIISPIDSAVLYAGTSEGHVYVSVNGGEKWTDMSDGLSGGAVRRLTIDASAKVLYAATEGGVFDYEIVTSPPSSP